MQLFDKEVLLQMVNKVEHAVKIDKTTMSVTRVCFARVCPSRLEEAINPFIEVLGNLQRIEYEGLHIICFECGGYGHRRENYPKVIKITENLETGEEQNRRIEGQ